jgi:hypothetical protein
MLTVHLLLPICYCRIGSEAEKFGCCKIVPPKAWKHKCQVDIPPHKPEQFNELQGQGQEQEQEQPCAGAATSGVSAGLLDAFTFPTNRQCVNTLQQGDGYTDGKDYDMQSYREMADRFKLQWIRYQLRHTGKTISTLVEAEALYSQECLTRDYWRIIETQCNEVRVDYGSDLDIQRYRSGFRRKPPVGTTVHPASSSSMASSPSAAATITTASAAVECAKATGSYPEEFYLQSAWNLNNLPNVEGSLLRHITTPINGVNVPWLYVGMLFSSFCWHTEDNYLNSINYNHYGDAKIWYGVPGASAGAFEKAAKTNFPLSFKESPDLLHQMNTQISPGLLYRWVYLLICCFVSALSVYSYSSGSLLAPACVVCVCVCVCV